MMQKPRRNFSCGHDARNALKARTARTTSFGNCHFGNVAPATSAFTYNWDDRHPILVTKLLPLSDHLSAGASIELRLRFPVVSVARPAHKPSRRKPVPRWPPPS
jgi:hypothetical protein